MPISTILLQNKILGEIMFKRLLCTTLMLLFSAMLFSNVITLLNGQTFEANIVGKQDDTIYVVTDNRQRVAVERQAVSSIVRNNVDVTQTVFGSNNFMSFPHKAENFTNITPLTPTDQNVDNLALQELRKISGDVRWIKNYIIISNVLAIILALIIAL